jgi:hypothetical protein
MNKAELRARFHGILNRTDCTDELADTFISDAITRASRYLRIPIFERVFATVLTEAVTFLPVPSDYVEMMDVTIDNIPLERVSYSQLLKKNTAGSACFYARFQNKFLFRPYVRDGAEVVFSYYGESAPFTSDTDTTPLSLIAEDLIIAGAMADASEYFQREDFQYWTAKFDRTLSDLQGQGDREAHSGGPLTVASMAEGQEY